MCMRKHWNSKHWNSKNLQGKCYESFDAEIVKKLRKLFKKIMTHHLNSYLKRMEALLYIKGIDLVHCLEIYKTMNQINPAYMWEFLDIFFDFFDLLGYALQSPYKGTM